VIWKSFTVPNQILEFILYIVKPALRGHLWDNEKVTLYGRGPLKRGSIHLKFSVIGQEKGDLLIQVTA